jgi:c-di-GMP-binding flagellar brake protein YcgR
MSVRLNVRLDRGQLVVLGIEEAGVPHWYQSRVCQHEPELVWVEAPLEKRGPVTPAVGAEVIVHTWRSTDARYTLRTNVAATELQPPALLGLRVLEFQRIQRREYFRVPLVARLDDAQLLGADGDEHSIVLQVCDVSAGGVRGRSATLRGQSAVLLHVGDQLRFNLPLPPEPDPLEVLARVVRVAEAVATAEYACEIGAAFVDLTTNGRERLIRFALCQQSQQLRRGML